MGGGGEPALLHGQGQVGHRVDVAPHVYLITCRCSVEHSRWLYSLEETQECRCGLT